MTPRIHAANADDHGLSVRWAHADNSAYYPWFWLRDHGEDEASLDPATRQRRIDTFSIPGSLTADAVRLAADGAGVHIDWNGGAEPGFVSAALLWRWREDAGDPASGSTRIVPERPLWTASDTERDAEIPRVGFASIVANDGDDSGLAKWLTHLHRFGFCVVDDVPTTLEATERLARRLAPPKHTIFGDLWTLSADETTHDDTAYTTHYLEPHTDGTYYHDAPGLQMFNCLEFDGKGGESVLVDGFALARELARCRPQDFELLTQVSVPGHYVEPGVHLQASRPVLRTDDAGQLQQVSFNNYDRAPFRLAGELMSRFYTAYTAFHELLVDQANWITIPLRPGNTLIFDNWRMLHGRLGYQGRRVFRGCYHDRADFESRLRVIGGG